MRVDTVNENIYLQIITKPSGLKKKTCIYKQFISNEIFIFGVFQTRFKLIIYTIYKLIMYTIYIYKENMKF